MQGYAGIGETSRALREFERCRAALAEELGADPSPQTRSVHLSLLTADPVMPVASPFIGRDEVTLRLRRLIEKSLTERRPAIVIVRGASDSGKTRLISEACTGISARQVVLPPTEDVTERRLDCVEHLIEALGTAPAAVRSGQLGQAIAASEPVVVIMAAAGLAQAVDLRRMYAILSKLEGAVTVVLDGVAADLEPVCTDLLAVDKARTDNRLFQIDVSPLRAEEVARLAQALLGGDVPLPLRRALTIETEGMPGRIVTTVREWLRVGQVAATAQGLILLPEGGQRPVDYKAYQMLAPLLDRLSERDLEVLELMAVLGQPASPLMIAPLLRDAEAPVDLEWVARRVQGSVNLLVDLSVLTSAPSGYAFRDPLFCDAVQSWLRPAARQGLHRRIAELAYISAEQRVGHWLAAGEALLARAAARQAATEAMAEGHYEDARAQLLEGCSLGGMIEVPPQDRIEMHELLGDVCVVLHRTDEARAAYAVASSVSQTHGRSDLVRLEAKQQELSADVDRRAPNVQVNAHATPAEQGQESGELALDASMPTDWGLEERLRTAVEEADRDGDHKSRAAARLQLAPLLFPRREFEGCRAFAYEALGLTVLPKIRARAILEFWLPGVLLGHAALAEGPMAHARDLAHDSDDVALARRMDVLALLIAHDLGRPSADELTRVAADEDELTADGYWSWISIRVATERGALAEAQLWDKRSLPEDTPPIVKQMRDLASAGLRVELGKVPEAIHLLRSVIVTGLASGSLLLLPEAIARLIALESPTDLDAAKEHFELLDWAAAGDHRFPRENCLRLIARAAVRAASCQFDGAAAAAAAAADVAENSALPFLAAQAHSVRAGHLAAAGRWSEARLAQASAARLRGTTSLPGHRRIDPSHSTLDKLVAITEGWNEAQPHDLIRIRRVSDPIPTFARG